MKRIGFLLLAVVSAGRRRRLHGATHLDRPMESCLPDLRRQIPPDTAIGN